jgi:hypothetical protein
VPAVLAGDGFFKICPKCYGVLWSKHSEEFACKRAEEAHQRKAVQEKAAHRRHLLKIERQRIKEERREKSKAQGEAQGKETATWETIR